MKEWVQERLKRALEEAEEVARLATQYLPKPHDLEETGDLEAVAEVTDGRLWVANRALCDIL